MHKPRRGAVGVVVEGSRFLVIRRSLTVRAPGLVCFPGGAIEEGETSEQAVVRELAEELHLSVFNPRLVWKSQTAWGTHLDWLVVDRSIDSQPKANPREVAEWMWIDAPALLDRSDLLGSVWDFFYAWADRRFDLPSTAGIPDLTWLQRFDRGS